MLLRKKPRNARLEKTYGCDGLAEVAVFIFPLFGHIEIDVDVRPVRGMCLCRGLRKQYESQKNAAADDD